MEPFAPQQDGVLNKPTDKLEPPLTDPGSFDSYEKREYAKDVNGIILKDEKGNYKKRHYSVYGLDEQNKHLIFYNEGVECEHVLASGTFPKLL